MPAFGSAMTDELWRLHARELTRYATLLVGVDDADDLVASVFARMSSGPTEVDNVRAYLFRSVTNAAVDLRRSGTRRQRRELRDAVAAIVGDDGSRSGGSDVDVRRAVARLSDRQRAVVYFAYWEDLGEKQIAELLGVSVGSVRRHLARARAHLRKALS